MSSYLVEYSRPARRELQRLDGGIVRRVMASVRELANTPRPAGCVKLADADDLWRIRVGDYRVVYAIDDSARSILITRVRHRREVYRG